MIYRRIRLNAPTMLPLTADDVALHLRLDPAAATGAEAPLLERMIRAATVAAENYASIAVMAQDWQLQVSYWPAGGLEIPTPPFVDLLRVGVGGTDHDLGDYRIASDSRFRATVHPVSGAWPALSPSAPAEIEYRAGAATPDDVDPPIQQAILMAIATWYENRESLQQFTLTPMIELGWEPLLDHYREPGFA